MYNNRQMLLGDIMDLLHSETQMKVVSWSGTELYGNFDHYNPIPDEMNECKVISIKHYIDGEILVTIVK